MLDERTLFVVMVVMPALLALVAVALRRGLGEDAQGFGLWSLAMACVAAASARIAWAGATVGFALQNLFWVGFMLSMAAAFWRFETGRALHPGFVVGAIGVYLGSLGLVGSPGLDAARISVLTLFASICFVSAALVVWRRPSSERGLGSAFVIGGAVLGLLATGYRALEGVVGGSGVVFMAGGSTAPVIWVFQAGLLSGLTLMTVGLILRATRRLNRRITDASTHDPLTGLSNRQEFQRRWGEEARVSGGPDAMVALVIVGLDEASGRGGEPSRVGDPEIRCLAASLVGMTPAGVFVGRVGGAQFAAMRACGDRDEALRWAESVRQRAIDDLQRGTRRAAVVNVGVAFGRPEADAGTLFSLAEAALYHARDSGASGAVLA